MSALNYVLIANIAVWAGIGGYLYFVSSQASRLEKRLDQLELLGDDDE